MRTGRQRCKSRDNDAQKRAARRKADKAGRQVHLSSGVWTWTCGRGTIVIRDPRNVSYKVDLSKLTGVPWDLIERHRWKKAGSDLDQGAVTPGMVKKYIEQAILVDRSPVRGNPGGSTE